VLFANFVTENGKLGLTKRRLGRWTLELFFAAT